MESLQDLLPSAILTSSSVHKTKTLYAKAPMEVLSLPLATVLLSRELLRSPRVKMKTMILKQRWGQASRLGMQQAALLSLLCSPSTLSVSG